MRDFDDARDLKIKEIMEKPNGSQIATKLSEMITARALANQKIGNDFLDKIFNLAKGFYAGFAAILFTVLDESGFFVSAFISLFTAAVFTFLWLINNNIRHRRLEDEARKHVKQFGDNEISVTGHVLLMEEFAEKCKSLEIIKLFWAMLWFLGASAILIFIGILT